MFQVVGGKKPTRKERFKGLGETDLFEKRKKNKRKKKKKTLFVTCERGGVIKVT